MYEPFGAAGIREIGGLIPDLLGHLRAVANAKSVYRECRFERPPPFTFFWIS